MESFFSRYRNPMMLGIVLLLQVFGLAVQLKRPVDPKHPEAGSVRMIRLWVSTVITPIERIFVGTGNWFSQGWHDYVNVGGLRRENEQLRVQNEQLRINQAQIANEAARAQRLEALLAFKQHSAIQTVAAQVIGSSGTEQSRVLYIDRGWRDGLEPDMAVVTPEGVVGKLRDVYRWTAQVLVVNDVTSGVGAVLENSRLHGVVKGTPNGILVLDHVMVDEKVEPGDRVITSGGDRVYPKGFPVGIVTQVCAPSRSRECEALLPGSDLFLSIRLKPAAELNRLEEVLVVTEPKPQQVETEAPIRAADVLAQRLPGVTTKTKENASDGGTGSQASGATGTQPPQTSGKTTGKNTPGAPPGNMPGNTNAAKPPLGITPGAAPATIPATTPPAGTTRVKAQTGRPAANGSGAATTARPRATPPPGESASPSAPVPIIIPSPSPTPTPPPAPTPASTPPTEAPKLP